MAFIHKSSQSFLTHARLWYLIDAKDQICGRLAVYLSQILQGKTKPIYHHGVDVGDHIVVVNTSKITITGKNWEQKVLRHHTGYPGGLREIPIKTIHKNDGTRILWRAVYGMVPKTKQRPVLMKRLYLFPDENHPFAENIYAKLEGPAPLSKRLVEYSAEEISDYPKIV